jgi:hypothetical protein
MKKQPNCYMIFQGDGPSVLTLNGHVLPMLEVLLFGLCICVVAFVLELAYKSKMKV